MSEYETEWAAEVPISLPTPSGLPRKIIRADSPPDEPPGVRLLFKGFTVLVKLGHENGEIFM